MISDGEQTKSSFVTYPLDGVTNLAADGVVIPFADGHTRQLPTLASGPFRFGTYAASYLQEAKRARAGQAGRHRRVGLSLLYPQDGIEGYSRDAFLDDLVGESEKDIRASLDAGAHKVQIDFTEGRLACKLDPSGGLLGTSLRSTTASSNASPTTSVPGSACTRAGRETWTRRTAPTSTTRSCCRTCSRLNVGNVYVEMAGEKDPGASSTSSRSTCAPNSGSSSA